MFNTPNRDILKKFTGIDCAIKLAYFKLMCHPVFFLFLFFFVFLDNQMLVLRPIMIDFMVL